MIALNEVLVEGNNSLLIIRGNHDDPQYWNYAEDWNKSNIEFVPDFTVKEINHMRYFFVGGGVSIDRSERIPGTSYWFDEGIVICPNPPKNIDVMVTHVPYPHIFNANMGNLYYWMNRDKNLEEQIKVENMKLMRMGEEVKPSYWFSGHFHMNKTVWNNGTKHTTLGINEFKEFEI